MASVTNLDDMASQEELIDVSELVQDEHKRKALEAIATAPDQPGKKNKRVRLQLDSGRALLTLI
jgi:hypothetical protein